MDEGDGITQFPSDILDKADYEPILEVMKRKVTENKGNSIIAQFLRDIAKHLKPEIYREIAFFFCLYRKAINLLGEGNCDDCNGEFLIEKSNDV